MSEKKTNKKNSWLYLSVLAVGVLLIVFALLSKGNDGNEAQLTDLELETEMEEGMDDNNGSVAGANYLEGVLYNSDDSARGNLKLVSSDSEVYIRTNRDFSSLVGLQVAVFIDGTLESFELIDIKPRLEKDGFLLEQ